VTNATQLNPLTSLPGNILIEKALHGVLSSTDKYCVVYFDIDNFKAYNDVYGFENGDRVIKNLADIITETVPAANFVGHVGGDDFVAIVRLEESGGICERILDKFDRSITHYYNDEDIQSGYIITKNRQGLEEQFPLISLSIGGVSIWERRFNNVFELSAESSRVKKECKMITGSAYMIA
jgi:diguanylate cyclase (GGDEF)-like protein